MRTSAFAFMCLADNVVQGDQHSSASSSQNTMTSYSLSLFSKLAALSMQQSGGGYTEALDDLSSRLSGTVRMISPEGEEVDIPKNMVKEAMAAGAQQI